MPIRLRDKLLALLCAILCAPAAHLVALLCCAGCALAGADCGPQGGTSGSGCCSGGASSCCAGPSDCCGGEDESSTEAACCFTPERDAQAAGCCECFLSPFLEGEDDRAPKARLPEPWFLSFLFAAASAWETPFLAAGKAARPEGARVWFWPPGGVRLNVLHCSYLC